MSILPAPPLLAPLASWFAGAQRKLPWRAEDLDAPHPDPYAVLVSELMLQQTQVATVLPYFQRWMARFPDAASLGIASEREVHKLWEGLGYYRRARHLHQAARQIACQGWPSDLAGLLRLPGVGPYTAAAIASIAFQQPEPALDGNAFRVLARVLGIEEDPKRQAAMLRTWLRPALEVHGPSRMTQAIMELGATLCAPVPHCSSCPLVQHCAAKTMGATDRIPPVAKRPKIQTSDAWLVAIAAEGCWLLHTARPEGLLAGLWCWPMVPTQSVRPAPPSPGTRTWKGWVQVYSHRKERIQPIALDLPHSIPPPPGMAWIPQAELASLPMGRRDQKLRLLLDQPGSTASETVDPGDLLAQIIPGGANPEL